MGVARTRVADGARPEHVAHASASWCRARFGRGVWLCMPAGPKQRGEILLLEALLGRMGMEGAAAGNHIGMRKVACARADAL